MIEDEQIGQAAPTLLDAYESGKMLARSAGSSKKRARLLMEKSAFFGIDSQVYLRLLMGQFEPNSDDDLRALTAIIRVPEWFDKDQRNGDAVARIEKYFLAIGKETSAASIGEALKRLKIEF